MVMARARITLPADEIETTDAGTGCLGEFEITAGFGDYGRSENPMLTAIYKGGSFVAEFACPDDARRLGEQLLIFARKAEENGEKRGPDYRAKLARDQFTADMKDALKRLETAVGVDAAPDLRAMFSSPIEGLESTPARAGKATAKGK